MFVSLRYWDSHNDQGGEQNSGAYIFRPMDGEFKPNPYSKFKHGTITQHKLGSLMTFYFENSGQRVMVHASIDSDFDVVKFTVDLDGLPCVQESGVEMIVDFKVEGFDNKQTFYTDSNGLEMQKRVLNYRPTWDMNLSYNESRENVTANYYPINTAISMKDLV